MKDNGTETVAEVAAEMTRLHAVFGAAAVDLTADYRKTRLAGEEGVTWAKFPKGRLGRPTPILDAVVRRGGVILLGAGYNGAHELLDEYQLAKTVMLVPGDDGTFVRADVITVHRSKAGFDPGDEYVVSGGRILKAGHDHHGPMPSLGFDGGMVWSASRSNLNGTFRALSEVDVELRKVVARLRAYEPAAE